MSRHLEVGGRQGRGDPEVMAHAANRPNRLSDDGRLLDPDSDWQDSAQAIMDHIPEPDDGTMSGAELALLAVIGCVSVGVMSALCWVLLWSGS